MRGVYHQASPDVDAHVVDVGTTVEDEVARQEI